MKGKDFLSMDFFMLVFTIVMVFLFMALSAVLALQDDIQSQGRYINHTTLKIRRGLIISLCILTPIYIILKAKYD